MALAAVLAVAAGLVFAGKADQAVQRCRQLADQPENGPMIDDCMLLQVKPAGVIIEKAIDLSANGQKVKAGFTIDHFTNAAETYVLLHKSSEGDKLDVSAKFTDRDGSAPVTCTRSWPVQVPGVPACNPIEVWYSKGSCALVCEP